MFFIDESGSIPKTLDRRYKHKYFVICFIHTKNPSRLENVYKNAIRDLRRNFTDFFSSLENSDELKASETPPFMKLYIINKLIEKTDFKIAHMVVDNWGIEQRFRDIPGRSFNYLIKIIVENFRLTSEDKNKLLLKVDNRNTALEGLRELEGFLYNQLVLEKPLLKGVKVEYMDSKFCKGVQVADMISHTIFQRFRYKTMPFPNYSELNQDDDLILPYTNEFLYQCIKPRIQIPFVFPVTNQMTREASATISL